MTLTLETPRLLIRSFCDADLESFLTYRNDPQVYRFQGWKTPFSRDDGLEFISNMKEIVPGTPGMWLQFAIVCRTALGLSSGMMIGDVAFNIVKSNPRMAYLGYTLSRSAWGHGYATEAVQKLLDYLFRELDLHRVVADCDIDNTASVHLLERLGFRREAYYIESYWLENDRTWGSEYLFAMLQREWIMR
jgi:RimJ/RimL family protein N-acetyltransferase